MLLLPSSFTPSSLRSRIMWTVKTKKRARVSVSTGAPFINRDGTVKQGSFKVSIRFASIKKLFKKLI